MKSCNICNKYFNSTDALNSHSRVHKNGYINTGYEALKKYNFEKNKNASILLENKKDLYEKNPKVCLNCSNPILYKKRINKFCSKSCAASYNNKLLPKKIRLSEENRFIYYLKLAKTHKIRKCIICQTEWIDIYLPDYNKTNTCSKECLSLYKSENAKNNFHTNMDPERRKEINRKSGLNSASKRIKRSIDEIKLFELCKLEFTNIGHNEQMFDGWDLDILLHDYKIGIMWNGIWHYKQLPMKNHSLLQVQNRDNIKIRLYESKGWKILIYEDRYFTPETAFLNIKEIINNQNSNI